MQKYSLRRRRGGLLADREPPGPGGPTRPGSRPERRPDRAATSELLKQAFRRYPTGVAVITAATPDGPVGLTVSSLASVSADPPAVSSSVNASGRSAEALLASARVSVHLLPESRRALADAFARSAAPRFTADQGWDWADGRPRLPDALATLTGVVVVTAPVGASVLVGVEIDDVRLGPDAPPLVHHDRGYRALGRPLVDSEVA